MSKFKLKTKAVSQPDMEIVNSNSSRRNLTIKPSPTLPQREHSFRKTLFHASPSSSTTTTTTTQARFVSTNNGDQNNTLYEDDKRIIHTVSLKLKPPAAEAMQQM
ncbi:hypothetical protein Lal_00026173 [Lupinus albus]|nr:hypothetical protein Lal_00026173 [Lupinus albus]